jgi:hypothetical protein
MRRRVPVLGAPGIAIAWVMQALCGKRGRASIRGIADTRTLGACAGRPRRPTDLSLSYLGSSQRPGPHRRIPTARRTPSSRPEGDSMSPTEHDDAPVPWMQQLLDNPFLLLFLGVLIPMLVYTVWGVVDILTIPISK